MEETDSPLLFITAIDRNQFFQIGSWLVSAQSASNRPVDHLEVLESCQEFPGTCVVIIASAGDSLLQGQISFTVFQKWFKGWRNAMAYILSKKPMKFIAILGLGAFIQSVSATKQVGCPTACEDWDKDCHGEAVRNNVRGEANIVDGINNSVDGFKNDIAGKDNRIRGELNGVRGDLNSILGANNRAVGNRNAIKGEDNRIKGELNVILGARNGIIGVDNKITGEYNEIHGERNAVRGVKNAVKGAENLVNGAENWVYGVRNKASGELNRIKGDANTVYGLDNTVVGNTNRVGTRCAIGDIPIENYNFKDFNVRLDAPCDLDCKLGGVKCKNGKC